MNQGLPISVAILFVIITITTGWLFWVASTKSKMVLWFMISWLLIQAFLGLNEFYMETKSIPPRVIFMILPPMILMIVIFGTISGKRFLNHFNASQLTLLQIIRLPVEMGLLLLFIHHMIPRLMTFEGRNFDIFSGLTAPLIWYFGYKKFLIGKKLLLAWHFICLALVLNVVIHGILSAPTVFQTMAFDQPNIAIIYFPFNWLPSFIVPIVIFSHLACIKPLLFPPASFRS